MGGDGNPSPLGKHFIYLTLITAYVTASTTAGFPAGTGDGENGTRVAEARNRERAAGTVGSEAMVNPARVDAAVDLAYGALILVAIALIATVEFGIGIAFAVGVFSAYLLHIVWKMARFDPDWMTSVVEDAVDDAVGDSVERAVEDSMDQSVDEQVAAQVDERVAEQVDETLGDRLEGTTSTDRAGEPTDDGDDR